MDERRTNDAMKPAATAARADTAKAASPPPAAPKAATGSDLDLSLEEIPRPDGMKEGFVGQER